MCICEKGKQHIGVWPCPGTIAGGGGGLGERAGAGGGRGRLPSANLDLVGAAVPSLLPLHSATSPSLRRSWDIVQDYETWFTDIADRVKIAVTRDQYNEGDAVIQCAVLCDWRHDLVLWVISAWRQLGDLHICDCSQFTCIFLLSMYSFLDVRKKNQLKDTNWYSKNMLMKNSFQVTTTNNSS